MRSSSQEPYGGHVVASEGDRGFFSEAEVARALEVLGCSKDRAETIAHDLYAQSAEAGMVFDDLLLSALASLSEDLSSRVMRLLRETEGEAQARMSRLQQHLVEQQRGADGTEE
jgi:hypothetical protein